MEYKLYVGGRLEKNLSLLRDDRERIFDKASLERSTTPRSPGLTSSELCPERLEWEFSRSFLQKERQLRERMTLLQKSRDVRGKRSLALPKDKKLSSSVNTGSTYLSSVR